MPRAPPTANTARPQMTLMPSRLAPAAPANAPLGIAWAANVDPRSTAKNPVIPAITATTDAAIQVLSIKALNTGGPQGRLGAVDGRAALGFLVRRVHGRPALPPGVAEQVGRQHQHDDEERHRPAVAVWWPV